MKSLIYFLIFIVVVCGAGVIHGAADKGVTKYQLSTHITGCKFRETCVRSADYTFQIV